MSSKKETKNSSKILPLLLTISLVIMVVLSGPGKTYADVAVGIIGFGYMEPNDQPPRICVDHRDVLLGIKTDSGINPFDYRSSSYAFAGEQLEFTIVVRDPNGAIDIGFPKVGVDGSSQVLCNEITLSHVSDYNCDGFGRLNSDTDKAYHCLLTVEPDWYREKDVKITVYDSSFKPTDATHVETWYFNPQMSLSVSTSDGQPIHFEQMPYGADTKEERAVHSLNRLKIKNTAEGGINMWMFLAGTDLYDPSGASKCPTSNVLEIEKYMQYRGWTGTQWTSSEGWEYMGKYNQDDNCVMPFESESVSHCYGGKSVPYPNTENVPNPSENVLTNQGTLEVEFKLEYPMPCVGSFSEGSIFVFAKSI